jgi:serine/threonine protein kinase
MAKGIFHSVCDAIDYLHSNNIMHRDIKVIQILLSHKIFYSIEKMWLSFVILVLPPIVNLE